MEKRDIFLVFLPVLALFSPVSLIGQDWQFDKETDGIRVYKRTEPGFSVKAYRCETEFQGDLNKVVQLITDVEKFDDWDDKISELAVVEESEGKYFKYCLTYDLSWPLRDRDLCIEAHISHEPATGITRVTARAAPDLQPLHPDRTRIVDYWQSWVVEPIDSGKIHLILEGFADPAGSIPSWVINMALTDSPLRSVTEVRKRAK